MAELNLTINRAFSDLWQSDYREYIYYGGRYGGKNYAISQFLCIKAIENKQRILVLREFNTNNKASVYADIKDFLVNNDIEFKLGDFNLLQVKTHNNELISYKATRIVLNFNQSEFIFYGINDNVIDNLKGLKDINYCWIDEAEFLTEYTHAKLKPTIRALNSKIIYSFNPERSDSFLYQRVLHNKDTRTFIKKIQASQYDSVNNRFIPKDNPFLNETILQDILADYKEKTPQMFAWIHNGEPYDIDNGNVINTDIVGYYNDTLDVAYNKLFITADTAFSKKENADYSVIGAFGLFENEIHLLRVWRGHWDFNELFTTLQSAYDYVLNKYKQSIECVIIEKKASGISLLQEFKRLSNIPIKEATPTQDKFTRISSVLSEFKRLRLPQDRLNPLNSWIDSFLSELRSFRADLAHKHDDQVDMLYYALDYAKVKDIDWKIFNS